MEYMKTLKGQSLYKIYTVLLEKSAYLSYLKLQNTLETQSRIENLQELGNVIEQKETRWPDDFLPMEDFLEEMSLLTEGDKTKEGKDFVTLMTLHNSKGLEFDTVFITGMEESLFPSFQSIEDNNLEEERRLAYVGMTRAKNRLILSYANKRKFWGRDQYNPPSRFLSEIPRELVELENSSLYEVDENNI